MENRIASISGRASDIQLSAPIKVELTPYQQKVENEINDFLHQEITFKGIANFFKGKK